MNSIGVRASIVIAEDEPAHAEAIRRTLESALPGVLVQVVGTLEEYRKLVSSQPPLIVLMDMYLPDGRAVDVLTQPAERGPFPILVMTSFGDQKMAVETMKAGALDYFPKTPDVIAATPRIVQRALREWALLQERKHSQLLLRGSEERYRALFENANDAIFLIKNGLFVECNPPASRMFGLRRNGMLGQPPSCLSPEVQPDGRRSDEKADALIQAALAGTPQVFEWMHVRADGTLFDAEVSLSRVELHDQSLVQAVVRDITERRRFEETLAEKNRQLERALLIRERFLASVSHELRTPLNAVIGLTGILLMKLPGPLTPNQEVNLQGVRTSALHLASIINDLLDISRLEAGQTEVHVEPLKPLDVMQEVVAALRPMAEEKRLQFSLAAPEESVSIPTDRRLLRQILFNLVNNAIKYTDSGSVVVTLECEDSGTASTVRCKIADTGVGVPIEEQHRLFIEFARLHRHTLPAKEGTGLGLYLSQRMAALLGGRIVFESEPDKGSVFTLILPMPRVEDEVR